MSILRLHLKSLASHSFNWFFFGLLEAHKDLWATQRGGALPLLKPNPPQLYEYQTRLHRFEPVTSLCKVELHATRPNRHWHLNWFLLPYESSFTNTFSEGLHLLWNSGEFCFHWGLSMCFLSFCLRFLYSFTNFVYIFFAVYWFIVVGCMVDIIMHISGLLYLISGMHFYAWTIFRNCLILYTFSWEMHIRCIFLCRAMEISVFIYLAAITLFPFGFK